MLMYNFDFAKPNHVHVIAVNRNISNDLGHFNTYEGSGMSLKILTIE